MTSLTIPASTDDVVGQLRAWLEGASNDDHEFVNGLALALYATQNCRNFTFQAGVKAGRRFIRIMEES